MRKLSPEQSAELERLYRETVAIVDWCTKYQHFSYGPAVLAALDKARDAKRLGAMRSLAGEFRGMFTSMPPEVRDQVFEAVRLETGVSLAPSDLLDSVTAEAIIQRGSIQNDDEYYLLRRYADGVANGTPSAASLASIEELLDSYR